ncbi:MAG: hypothetical protein RLY20_1159 [Verrucomicrobiota bacterium]|jgi:hypothetical protein
MKPLGNFLTLGLLVISLCSGCGLVPVPSAHYIPNPPGRIELMDGLTKQVITNAEVAMFADRYSNWMKSFPPSCSSDFKTPRATSVVLNLHRDAAGRFVPERRRVKCNIRPWGFGPLGMAMYDDYAVTVSARSQGYLPISVTFARLGPFGGFMSPTAYPNLPYPQFDADGTMTIYLSPESNMTNSRSNPANQN